MEGRVRAAQLQAIFRLTPLTMAVNCANVGLMIVVLRAVANPIALGLWATIVLGMAVLGFLSWTRDRRGPRRVTASVRAFHRATVHAALLGLAWGVVPVFWFPQLGNQERLVVASVATGMICAGGFALATVPPAAIAFVAALSAASMVGIMMSDVVYRELLGVLLIGYGMTVMRSVMSTARLFVDRFRAEADLEERRLVIALLLAEFEENGSDWLFELDEHLHVVNASSRFVQVAAMSAPALEGIALNELLEHASEAQLMSLVRAGNPFRDLEVEVARDATTRWWTLSASPMLDDGGRVVGWRGVGSDTTDVRIAQNEIAWMARTDILTGLINRTAFRDRAADNLVAARLSGESVAIGCLDLDYFKSVNDSLGHEAGDVLLREVSLELMRFADQGVTVGRLGGDEFGLLFTGQVSTEQVQQLAERMIERLSRSYDIQGSSVTIGATVGIAFGHEDGNTVDELIRNADLALYRGKESARGKAVRYSTLMLREAEERRAIKEELLPALRRQEFVLHYQPIIETATRRTVAFEALVRWQHPTRGLLGPDAFIGIAEASGTIVALGDWILRESCRQAARLPAHVKVAVNLSPAQLGSSRLTQVVKDAVALAGITPDRLELEITEALLLANDNITMKFLHDMQEMGVGVALDDFGIGFSSLNYLTRFPVSKIKIDRSFVSGGASLVHRSAIIQAVTGMAERLGFSTTAEGVETAESLEWVTEMGCTQAQGYLFARAMPALEIPSYLAAEMRAASSGVSAARQTAIASAGAGR